MINIGNYEFEFDTPLVFLALIPILFFVCFLFFRTPKNKRNRLGRYVALVARILTALVVVTMLSGLHVTEVETIPPDKTQMVLVADLSDSTAPLKDEMTAFIRDIIDEAEETGEEISMGVVTFAADSISTIPMNRDLEAVYTAFLNGTGSSPTDATDIEGAIEAASKLFQEERSIRRVVLLSDGRQTEGNAYQAAKQPRADGNRMDAISFNVTDSDYAEVALSSVQVTRNLLLGETVSIRVVVRSTVETFCRIQVFDGDTLVAESPQALTVGAKTFNFTYTPEEKGIHCIRVAIAEPEASQNQHLNDSISYNNSLCNWCYVVGKATVLVVDNTGIGTSRVESSVLDTYDIVSITTDQFPTTMEELLNYDEVILADLYYHDLPKGADELLLRYVSKIGRGLFITGGTETELLKSYSGTPLEDVIPVTMTLDETEYNVALLVVLDVSGSMVGNVDRLTPAKEGAIRCLDPLGEHDLFGVVTFAGEGTRYLEMTPLVDKEYIVEKLNAIDTNSASSGLAGGTNYGDALIKAYHMMNACKADSKQVIFISDGEPSNSSPFQALPSAYKNAGMSLSTIYIGPDTDAADSVAQQILKTMADNGDGNFYAVVDSQGVGDLLVELTDNVKRAMFINEGIIDLYDAGIGSSVLDGVSLKNVILNGYLGSAAKTDPDTKMAIYANDHRPIYAEKNVGLGRVGVFLSGITTDWCASLTLTDSGNLLLRNIIESCMNDVVDSTGLTVTGNQVYMGTQLVVKPTLDLPGQQLQMVVTKWTGEAVSTIQLTRVGSTGYYGTFTTDDPNNLYILDVRLLDAEGNLQDRTKLAYSGGYIKEYDIFSDTGIDLLEGVSHRTGGEVMKKADALFKINPPEVQEYEVSLLGPSCIILAALIFIDIIARHLIFPKKKKPELG